jgi:hypothetical protein
MPMESQPKSGCNRPPPRVHELDRLNRVHNLNFFLESRFGFILI